VTTLTGVLLAVVLGTLSLLHFYWSLGGKRGFDGALPKDASGRRVLNPGRASCAVVATGLLAFAGYYLVRVGLVPVRLPGWLLTYGTWGVAALFALRTLGDFGYVGLTKKIRHTNFARRDTRYYSPLCGLLALGAVLIGVLR
jgi:hypothetical protein